MKIIHIIGETLNVSPEGNYAVFVFAVTNNYKQDTERILPEQVDDSRIIRAIVRVHFIPTCILGFDA